MSTTFPSGLAPMKAVSGTLPPDGDHVAVIMTDAGMLQLRDQSPAAAATQAGVSAPSGERQIFPRQTKRTRTFFIGRKNRKFSRQSCVAGDRHLATV